MLMKYKNFECFCKCCPGIVVIKLPICTNEADYLIERAKANGCCDICGTYYDGAEILSKEQITGPKRITKDRRLPIRGNKL